MTMAEHDRTGPSRGQAPVHAAGPAEAFKPGAMDIRDQEKTFSAFVTWTMRSVVVIAAVLVLLALVAR